MVPLFSRGCIEDDDLGKIKYFRVGHQCLDDSDADLISLSAMLFGKITWILVSIV